MGPASKPKRCPERPWSFPQPALGAVKPWPGCTLLNMKRYGEDVRILAKSLETIRDAPTPSLLRFPPTPSLLLPHPSRPLLPAEGSAWILMPQLGSLASPI